MKPSINVPLTNAQRRALVRAGEYYIQRGNNSIGAAGAALRNALARLQKAEVSADNQPEGSVAGSAASGAGEPQDY
jgi:hypothetical protein